MGSRVAHPRDFLLSSPFRGSEERAPRQYRSQVVKQLLVSLFLALSLASAESAETLTGRVVGVADGDTLTILVDRSTTVIRLDGIDAPEKGQAFGQAAKRSLSDLAFDRTATATCHKVDRYQRRVCAVTVDGRDVGEELIRRGHAWVFTRYAHELPAVRRGAYGDAERRAREGHRGLWQDASPVPPWKWRQMKRSSSGDMGTWGH
jgi:endonuclease YncB( thermonuclease family)